MLGRKPKKIIALLRRMGASVRMVELEVDIGLMSDKAIDQMYRAVVILDSKQKRG